MADPLVTQADLETRFPPAIVKAIFCDDRTGLAGPRLALALNEGSRQAEAILMTAFTLAQIATLVSEDEAVKGAICRLVVSMGVEGKPEWSGDGAPYTALKKDARTTLGDVAKARLRSRGEPVAGANTTHLPTVSHAEPTFQFAPTRNRQNPGGY